MQWQWQDAPHSMPVALGEHQICAGPGKVDLCAVLQAQVHRLPGCASPARRAARRAASSAAVNRAAAASCGASVPSPCPTRKGSVGWTPRTYLLCQNGLGLSVCRSPRPPAVALARGKQSSYFQTNSPALMDALDKIDLGWVQETVPFAFNWTGDIGKDLLGMVSKLGTRGVALKPAIEAIQEQQF